MVRIAFLNLKRAILKIKIFNGHMSHHPSMHDAGIEHVGGNMFEEVPKGNAIMLKVSAKFSKFDWRVK